MSPYYIRRIIFTWLTDRGHTAPRWSMARSRQWRRTDAPERRRRNRTETAERHNGDGDGRSPCHGAHCHNDPSCSLQPYRYDRRRRSESATAAICPRRFTEPRPPPAPGDQRWLAAGRRHRTRCGRRIQMGRSFTIWAAPESPLPRPPAATERLTALRSYQKSAPKGTKFANTPSWKRS